MNKYKELFDELAHYWNEETLERMLGEYKELVELATPKKTVGIACPNCGAYPNKYTNNCHGCGQKIDWSDE